MILPAVLYVTALVGLPFVLAILYSVTDAKVASEGLRFVGLRNFEDILASPSFRRALFDSFLFTVSSQVLVLAGATVLALALKEAFRGRGNVKVVALEKVAS